MEPKKEMVLFVKDAEFVKRHTAVEKKIIYCFCMNEGSLRVKPIF